MKPETILKKLKITNYKLRDVSKGYDHEVYLVSSAQGEFALRIPHNEKAKLIAQSWAFSEWAKLGIPVPQTIKKTEDWLLEERIPGKDMSDCRLSIGQKKKILFLLGKYAKKMHSVKVKGFGYIKQAGKGIDRSWKVFLGEDGDGILEEVRKKHIVERKLLEGMERSWESGKGKYLDIKQGVLLHGDLADDNVMVEHGELSGIIDTDALSGDPYYDLGMVYEGFFDKPLVDAFFRGYGKVDLERVRFYAIYYLGWLCILHQKEKRKLDVVKRKLRKILEEGLK